MNDLQLPETMKAIEYRGAAELDVVAERPVPQPAAGEVLLRVRAAGINNADILQRRGEYPPPAGASDIPGLEASGTIVAAGKDVRGWNIGDGACALLAGGGYAEYVSVPAGQLAPIPRGVSATDAAALPEVAATTWANLVMHGNATEGETALVHGGAGGIGSFAVQLLRELGLRVITTAGSREKAEYCRTLGADHVIDYRDEDFTARTHEITEGAGVDIILDIMGGSYLPGNVKALATGGRLVIIAMQGGAKGELSIPALMAKRAWITGTTLRARSVEEKTEIMSQVAEHVWPLIERGGIAPQVSDVFALTDAAEAQERFQQRDRRGKILLRA
ncbi:NAD(P)H-quinone oxidoreductase [uncultured Agrococcus sp.]|uniref:NAD(P)H-quinone oxidoreductase n=1 Tax=uncultured Agrococcus sp. TaxID=382258 RepID=UPI0025DA9118|nr:NAD(P)H-quinone oxidoreductase [uncultured Agrococcus sp.]